MRLMSIDFAVISTMYLDVENGQKPLRKHFKANNTWLLLLVWPPQVHFMCHLSYITTFVSGFDFAFFNNLTLYSQNLISKPLQKRHQICTFCTLWACIQTTFFNALKLERYFERYLLSNTVGSWDNNPPCKPFLDHLSILIIAMLIKSVTVITYQSLLYIADLCCKRPRNRPLHPGFDNQYNLVITCLNIFYWSILVIIGWMYANDTQWLRSCQEVNTMYGDSPLGVNTHWFSC